MPLIPSVDHNGIELLIRKGEDKNNELGKLVEKYKSRLTFNEFPALATSSTGHQSQIMIVRVSLAAIEIVPPTNFYTEVKAWYLKLRPQEQKMMQDFEQLLRQYLSPTEQEQRLLFVSKPNATLFNHSDSNLSLIPEEPKHVSEESDECCLIL